MPVGNWDNCAFWITNYDGFVSSAISRKQWPGALADFASPALNIYDKVSKSSLPRQNHPLHRQNAFDDRFNVFWQELQQSYPRRFLATRSRDVLDWHFKFSLAENRAWVVTYEVDSRVSAYAIFQRQDHHDINLKRVRLIDYQALPGSGDRSSSEDAILESILAWGLNECAAQGIHMLEAIGFRPDKRRVIDRFCPSPASTCCLGDIFIRHPAKRCNKNCMIRMPGILLCSMVTQACSAAKAIYGVIAITRKGLPDPPTIFSGAAMTIAPVGGS